VQLYLYASHDLDQGSVFPNEASHEQTLGEPQTTPTRIEDSRLSNTAFFASHRGRCQYCHCMLEDIEVVGLGV